MRIKSLPYFCVGRSDPPKNTSVKKINFSLICTVCIIPKNKSPQKHVWLLFWVLPVLRFIHCINRYIHCLFIRQYQTSNIRRTGNYNEKFHIYVYIYSSAISWKCAKNNMFIGNLRINVWRSDSFVDLAIMYTPHTPLYMSETRDS